MFPRLNLFYSPVNARNESLEIKKYHFSEFEIYCTDFKMVVAKIEQWSYNMFVINIALFEVISSSTPSSDFDASVYLNSIFFFIFVKMVFILFV